METQSSTETNSRINRKLLIRWLIIILGGGLFVVAGIRIWSDYKSYFSPLDQIDIGSVQEDQGFVPLYAREDKGSPRDSAPIVLGAPQKTPDIPTQSVPNEKTPSSVPESKIDKKPTSPTDIKPDPTNTLPPEYIPDRIKIPSINLDAPITPVHQKEITVNEDTFLQWVAPDYFAAGWHDTSASLGVPGNTVLNGHHNLAGEVFRDIHTLKVGNQIILYAGDKAFVYQVASTMILKERFQPLEVRLENARWILHSNDERLTLITCWPYESNTHRVVVVALPSEMDENIQ